MVGRMLFFRNQARGETLTRLAAAEPTAAGRFLDWLESDPDLRDADKVAFPRSPIWMRRRLWSSRARARHARTPATRSK